MSKAKRGLAVAGAGLLAGATFGTGIAYAAPGEPPPRPGHDNVVGQFGSLSACQTISRMGQELGLWQDYDCHNHRMGGRRVFVLIIDYQEWEPSRPSGPDLPSAPGTPGPAPTGTAGPAPSPTGTASPAPTDTASPTPTDTVTPAPTGTASPTPTDTASPTPTAADAVVGAGGMPAR